MLKDCIAKAGKNIPPAFVDRLLDRFEALAETGMPVDAAEQQAVREALDEVRKEGERLAAGVTPSEDKRSKFQQFIAENKRKVAAQKEAIAASAAPDGSILLVSTRYPGEVVFFSPNVGHPGWRVTRFVDRVPYGHNEFKTREDAIASYSGESGNWGPPHASERDYRPAASTERFSLGDQVLEGGDRIGQEDQGRQKEVLTAAASTGPEGQPKPLRSPETRHLAHRIAANAERNALERERLAARLAGKPVAEIDRRIDAVDNTPRESLGDAIDGATVRVESDRIRQEYPSAPEFVIESGLSGDNPRTGAAYRDGKIHVYPAALGSRKQARNAILGALTEAGADLFEPSFWDRLWTLARGADPDALRRLMVRHDTATPEGKRAVLGELLMEHMRGDHVSTPLRRMIRSLKGYSTKEFAYQLARYAAAKEFFRPVTLMPSTDKTWMGRKFEAGAGYVTELFPTEAAAREFAGDAGTVRDVTQEKAYADLHGSWYRTLSPRLASLRSLAAELGYDARDRQLWENLERYLRSVAEAAEAAALPHGRERLNPESSSFPDEFATLAGRPLTERELDAWTRYQAELAARRTVKRLDRLDELERVDASLVDADPRWSGADLEEDRKRFRTMITRLRRQIEKVPDEIRARADEIRGQREVLARAKAAETVLADPFWVQAAEMIDRIDDAAVTSSSLENLAPELRHAAEAVRNHFHATYLAFRSRVSKLAGTENERIDAELRRLRDRLTKARMDSGAAEVAIKEVRDALEGAHGTSGSLESRAIVTALRDMDTAIQQFARELAAARPDTAVWKLREMVEALDPTVPLEMREDYRAEVAAAMGLSVDALSRIVDLIQRYDEFRNGILAMHDAAERAAGTATITAIEEIERLLASSASKYAEAARMEDEAESAGDIKEAEDAARAAAADRAAAMRLAGRTVTRLRRAWKGRERMARTLNDEIADALIERMGSDMLLDSSSEEVADPGYVREMIYHTTDGEYLAPFIRVDGTEQPGIHMRPGDDYTEDVLARVSEWRDQARAVVASGEATSNDMETVRGLAVAVSAEGDAGVSKYIDPMALPAMRKKLKAPGRGMNLATDPNLGIKNMLANLVPGVLGSRLREKGAQYIRAEQEINRTINASIRREYQLIKAAAKSLGINLRSPGGAGKFEAAYNEAAHALRQFNSGVAPGNLLWRRAVQGREITPELLALIRFHRDTFAQLQDWLGQEPYGGVRMRFPGRRVVRAPAPTGDIGLGRFARRARLEKLAEAYREAADTGTETPILTFWNKDPDALLSHIFDSERNDLGAERDPVLLRAAQDAARDLRRRGRSASVPTTVDDWADYLATFITTVPEARRYAREHLLGDLAQYGNLARSLFAGDSKAPAEGAGVYQGENDANEFNSPAAKLMYPSAWYTYGASDGLRAAVERIADRRQVEYFSALLAARDDLRIRADKVREAISRIEAGVDDPSIIDPVRDDVIWHTHGLFSGTKVTRRRMAAALRMMNKRAAAIDAHFLDMSRKRTTNPISRGLSQIVPFMLASFTSALTNILGGPVRQFTMLRPLVGTPGAALSVPLGVGMSALNAAYEGLVGLLPESIRTRFKTREERNAYLTSMGLGSSYSRQEMAELETFASGLPGKGPIGQAWGKVQEGVRALSERVGVHAGDKALNRYASRNVIPLLVWRLQTMARAWRARVGTAYDPTNPEHVLSAQDVRAAFDVTGEVGSGDVARVREILSSIGMGNPEDVLTMLAQEGVNYRLFWRSPVGRAIGSWALSEFNVANRLNRPTPSLLGFLWGWASSSTAALLEDARTTPEEGLPSRLGHGAVWAAGVAASAALTAYGATMGKAAAMSALSSVSAALAAALKPDDDDDPGAVDIAMDLLSRFAGAFQSYTLPKQTIGDRSFWMNAGPDATPGTADDQFKDPLELTGKVAASIASAYGWDVENARIPAFSVGYQVVRSGAQMGRGMYEWTEGKIKGDPGLVVGGQSDTQEGARQLSSMFGLVGKTIYNMRYPEDQEGRISRQAITAAANELGIQKATPPPVTGFMAPTPVRRELQEAGRAIIDGDPDAAERARSVASFIWQRSYERSIRAGDNDEVARKNADSAVKRNLSGINPFETALGRTLTPEQYARLKAALGNNPAIKRDEAAAEAVIKAISEKPPGEMRPFAPSPAMMSPVRTEGSSRGIRRISLRTGGGGRRRGLGRAGTGLRRRGRLPKPRKVRIRWA